MKHISKPITFLLYELAGSIKSHFVEHLLLCCFFIETNFQLRILLKKNLIFKSSQDFWPTLYTTHTSPVNEGEARRFVDPDAIRPYGILVKKERMSN